MQNIRAGVSIFSAFPHSLSPWPLTSLSSLLFCHPPSHYLPSPLHLPLIFLPSSSHLTSADPIFSSSFARLLLFWPFLIHLSAVTQVCSLPLSLLFSSCCFVLLIFPFFCFVLHRPSIHLFIYLYLPSITPFDTLPSCPQIQSLFHSPFHLYFQLFLSLSCCLSFDLPFYLIVLICLHFHHPTPSHLVLWFNLPSSSSPPRPSFPPSLNLRNHLYFSFFWSLPENHFSLGFTLFIDQLRDMIHCWQEYSVFKKYHSASRVQVSAAKAVAKKHPNMFSFSFFHWFDPKICTLCNKNACSSMGHFLRNRSTWYIAKTVISEQT